ncbi:hypothetical protein IE53DRAFT_71439 [Violaceomyces palustris]|uniref:Uncharacterized protein n=1 Tax=Violaceomyces palustris TaxID=1673888 RepID=A0ACD0P7F2_9BASI|nr:hypothetical protein IE53DRAFT_71439 [Violaceomyces palustris]
MHINRRGRVRLRFLFLFLFLFFCFARTNSANIHICVYSSSWFVLVLVERRSERKSWPGLVVAHLSLLLKHAFQSLNTTSSSPKLVEERATR